MRVPSNSLWQVKTVVMMTVRKEQLHFYLESYRRRLSLKVSDLFTGENKVFSNTSLSCHFPAHKPIVERSGLKWQVALGT